ncbi:MAG: hypothetical protein Q9187_003663 [Circinaria calcarea]
MSDQSSNRPLDGQQDMSNHPQFAALSQRLTILEALVLAQQSTISDLTRSVNELRTANQAQPGDSGLGGSRPEARNRDRSDPHQSRGREGRNVPQQRHGHTRMPSRSRSPLIHHPHPRREASPIESDDSLMGAHTGGSGRHRDMQRLSALPSPRPRPADMDTLLDEGSSRLQSGLQQPESSTSGNRRPPTGNSDLATGSSDPQAVEQYSPPRETRTLEAEEPMDEINGILAKVMVKLAELEAEHREEELELEELKAKSKRLDEEIADALKEWEEEERKLMEVPDENSEKYRATMAIISTVKACEKKEADMIKDALERFDMKDKSVEPGDADRAAALPPNPYLQQLEEEMAEWWADKSDMESYVETEFTESDLVETNKMLAEMGES